MKQVIYLNIDDSGKISTKEDYSVYGGVVFFSKPEKDKFITQYGSIIKDIKCKYNQSELKHNNLKQSDLRRLLNYIKKYYTFAIIIDNKRLYPYIINDKASKGRYLDFAVRLMIKGVIKDLIEYSIIDPQKDLKIIINIDEQTTKSNGYYNLHDGLIEELKYGIKNYNYNKVHAPIIYSNLEIKLTYQHSDSSYAVQGADLIAGTVRSVAIKSNKDYQKLKEKLSYMNYIEILPIEKEQ